MAHSERVDILLVEDSPHERELTLRALRKGDRAINVFEVKDGEEALDFIFARGDYAQRAPEAPPRLVLLDLKIPKVNGLEVLRQIKANDDTKTIPVVILTSSQEDRDITDSYKLGVNSYTVKPMDFDEFVRCVLKVGDYWLTCNRLPR